MSRRRAAFAATAALALLTGCAEADERSGLAQWANDETTALSRVLDPPIAVPPDRHLGRSLGALIAAEVAGSDAAHGPTVAECVTHHYARGGMIVAVHERCAGSHQRLFLYRALALWWVFGDLGDDDVIDAWFDPHDGGLLLEDVNFDTVADRRSESFQRLAPDHPSLGAFADWELAPVLDQHILDDTDGDGSYDLETITAGMDAAGQQSHFRRR